MKLIKERVIRRSEYGTARAYILWNDVLFIWIKRKRQWLPRIEVYPDIFYFAAYRKIMREREASGGDDLTHPLD